MPLDFPRMLNSGLISLPPPRGVLAPRSLESVKEKKLVSLPTGKMFGLELMVFLTVSFVVFPMHRWLLLGFNVVIPLVLVIVQISLGPKNLSDLG